MYTIFKYIMDWARENIDKLVHTIVSYLLFTSIFVGLLIFTSFTILNAAIWAAGISLGIGIAKEIVDAMGFGHPSIWDIVANAIGVLPAFAAILLIIFI